MISPTIRGFYTQRALSRLGYSLYIPVWVLYLLSKGIDMTDIALLLSIQNLTQLAAEVPTGIVADRFSRRGSVAIAHGLLAACFVLIILADTFAVLTVAYVILGISEAFYSGAESALVFDALKAEGRDDEFQHVFGTGQSIGIVSLLIGTATCGVVSAHLGMATALWGSAAFVTLGGLIALTIPEPVFLIAERQQRSDATFAQAVVDYGRHLASSVRVVHGSTALRALFVMKAILLVPFFLVQHYYTQPYLATFDYSAPQISYVYTLLYLVQAVLSKYSATIRAALNTEQRTYAVLTILTLVYIVSMAHAPTALVAIAGLVLARTTAGLAQPTLQESLNRRLDSGQRASCLSLATMGQSLLAALCFPLFGHIADTWSLRTSLWVLEGVFVPLLIGTWIAGRWLREQPVSTEAVDTST